MKKRNLNCKCCKNNMMSSKNTYNTCRGNSKKSLCKKIIQYLLVTTFIVISIIGLKTNNNVAVNKDSKTFKSIDVIDENRKVEQTNFQEYEYALRQAQTYSDMMYMSKKGIFDQLTSEYGGQFSDEVAQYAVDNIEVNWKENALKSAELYLDIIVLSEDAIYDQLSSENGEKFTEEEAQYAVDNLK